MTETNVLTDIPWMITNRGLKTVREVLVDDSLDLSIDVPGFVYGAQFRFLMTIVPLVILEKASLRAPFAPEAVNQVLARLAPHADLFDSTQPFLQVTSADVDGRPFADFTEASKLFPHGMGAKDNQSRFWSFDSEQTEFTLHEAVLRLVAFYFYGPGTNTALLKGRGLKLSNGASALRYKDSVEIIAVGSSLHETLLMNTPRKFIEGEDSKIFPHWADRSGNMNAGHPLWRFSWSANTVACQWAEGKLVGVVRGGIPEAWSVVIPKLEGDDWGKTFHDQRLMDDPLYFYTKTGEGLLKLLRFSLSSEPHAVVAQWHADRMTEQLEDKWRNNLLNANSYLQNLLFLEHATEGTAQSFSIRYSKIVRGYRDELVPDHSLLLTISERYRKVLAMKGKLIKLFSENGTCNHLANQKADVELAFWNEMQEMADRILTEPETRLTQEEIEHEITRRAVKAFETISSRRNTVHIEKHLKALNHIYGTFRK